MGTHSLRFFKHEFGLTADDARTFDTSTLKRSSLEDQKKVLEFFENKFGLTVNDLRPYNENWCTIS